MKKSSHIPLRHLMVTLSYERSSQTLWSPDMWTQAATRQTHSRKLFFYIDSVFIIMNAVISVFLSE